MKVTFRLLGCVLLPAVLVAVGDAFSAGDAPAKPAKAASSIINLNAIKSPTSPLDSLVANVIDSANVPGLALAVVRQGALAHAQGYGVRDTRTNAAVDTATVFNAASLSKPVFAYAVLQLADEGRLDLDAPLYRYLPYPDLAADARYRRITARMVLGHTTGLPNWRGNAKLTLVADPGRQFGYSGEGFVYLQKVVEKLTGKPLDQFMQERVFRPLGMRRSSYVWQEKFTSNHAAPHNTFALPIPHKKYDKANAAFSLQTTAPDYARFLLAVLHGKRLRPATRRQMLSVHTGVPNRLEGNGPLSDSLAWGLGFGLQNPKSRPTFWHWGDNDAFKCFVIADPATQTGIVYFSNGYNGLNLARRLVAHVIAGPQPFVRFLGFDSYRAPNSMFASRLLRLGADQAIAPYLGPGGTSTIPEGEMNWIGHELLAAGKPDVAQQVFDLNRRAYPTSARVHGSYAYALLNNGQLDSAAVHYRKSLSIDPGDDRAARVLKGLERAANPKGRTEVVLRGLPEARLVTLAGAFNDWDPTHTFFTRRGGDWVCYPDLPPGRHPYRIVVDGDWRLDPGNPATGKDAQGRPCSLLIVP